MWSSLPPPPPQPPPPRPPSTYRAPEFLLLLRAIAPPRPDASAFWFRLTRRTTPWARRSDCRQRRTRWSSTARARRPTWARIFRFSEAAGLMAVTVASSAHGGPVQVRDRESVDRFSRRQESDSFRGRPECGAGPGKQHSSSSNPGHRVRHHHAIPVRRCPLRAQPRPTFRRTI